MKKFYVKNLLRAKVVFLMKNEECEMKNEAKKHQK
jgi:hypothetical protein